MNALTIIRGAHVYGPKDLGTKDVLIGGRQILAIGEDIAMTGKTMEARIVEAKGMMLFPGLVDQHVHMAGGGGEGGFHYRTPEIALTHLSTAGVTTAVGVLGTDGVTRSTRELLAKANGLDFEGISTYIYCGAYQVPTRTITGTPRSDIVLIDKVIGIGEIAISDSRSSHPNEQEIAELASEAHVGGLLSGKAGVVHFHVGDDESRLDVIERVADKTQLPLSVFIPTHLNRNPDLLHASIAWGKRGGICDITSGIRPDKNDKISVKPSKAIAKLLAKGVHPAYITMSSDSNGSAPIFDERGELKSMGIGTVSSLWEETVDLIREEHIPIETAIRIVTRNVAHHLKLHYKGRIHPGCDADFILCDASYQIQMVFAKGRCMVEEGKPIVRGTFEQIEDRPGELGKGSLSSKSKVTEAQPVLDPALEDDEDFPDRDDRQKMSRKRYCC